MAEHGLTGPVIGLAADGTGYGTDGAIWGCELMSCDTRAFRRLGHLRYFPLAGGDAAAREPWRPAVALLRQAFGDDWQREASFAVGGVDSVAVHLLEQRLERGANVPLTSSLGRLFDAVACILGVCRRNRFEAEAAMALEAAAAESNARGATLPFELVGRSRDSVPQLRDQGTSDASGASAVGLPLRSRPNRAGSVLRTVHPACLSSHQPGMELDVCGIVRALVRGMHDGTPVPDLARAFHSTLAAMFADALQQAAKRENLDQVVLSGGCFLNKLLLGLLTDRLADTRLEVYIQKRVPTGDGGLALGQAVIAMEETKANG